MLATTSPDKNKILVPYKNNNTGNFIGYYTTSNGIGANATISGQYGMYPKAFTMNGELSTGGKVLDQHFVLYSTSGNAVIYLDCVKGASSSQIITKEQGGLMAVSTDPFTKETRTLYYDGGAFNSDGSNLTKFKSNWVNIDNQIGIVSVRSKNQMAFGDRTLLNSIYTSKIYPCYADTSWSVSPMFPQNYRNVIYYSNVDKAMTAALCDKIQLLTDAANNTTKWNGIVVPDPDGTNYLLLSNFNDPFSKNGQPVRITCKEGAPVFNQTTTIRNDSASAVFYCINDFNIANELKVFVKGTGLFAVQQDGNAEAAFFHNETKTIRKALITIISNGKKVKREIYIPAGETYLAEAINGTIKAIKVDKFSGDYRDVAYGTYVYANSQRPNNLPFCVIDGNDDTYYESLGNPNDGVEYLSFCLRNLYKINKIVITPVAGLAPTNISVQTSMIDDNFQNIIKATICDSDRPTEISFDSIQTRFVRIKINSGNTVRCAVRKIQIMGTPVAEN